MTRTALRALSISIQVLSVARWVLHVSNLAGKAAALMWGCLLEWEECAGHLLQAGGGQPLDGLQRDAGGGGDA